MASITTKFGIGEKIKYLIRRNGRTRIRHGRIRRITISKMNLRCRKTNILYTIEDLSERNRTIRELVVNENELFPFSLKCAEIIESIANNKP